MYPRRRLPAGFKGDVKKRKKLDKELEQEHCNAVVSERLLDSHLGRTVGDSTTQAQWVSITTFVAKVNKRLRNLKRAEVNSRVLTKFLNRIGEAALERIGVFRHSFGKKNVPIILVNPGYARALKQAKGAKICACSSGVRIRNPSSNARLLRVGVISGGHRANCPLWRPPPTHNLAHLHAVQIEREHVSGTPHKKTQGK